MRKSLRRYLISPTLVTLSLLAMLAIVEATTFFVFDIKPPGYNPGRFFQFSPIFGYYQVPNAEGYWYRYADGSKYYVRINSFGFSDKKRTTKKERPRIAIIGDSTAQFWEAPELKRGHLLLEKELKGQYEVLNMGIRGYETTRTFLLFEKIGSQFSPDVVIYFFCINDIMANIEKFQNFKKQLTKPYYRLDHETGRLSLTGYPLQRFGKSEIPWYEHLFSYKLMSKFIRQQSPWLYGIFFNAIPEPTLEQMEDLHPYEKTYDEKMSLAWEVTEKLIISFADKLKERGITFLLVEGVHKWSYDEEYKRVFTNRYGNIFDFTKVTRLLADMSQRNNISFLSLQDEAKKARLHIDDLLHIEDAVHLDENGQIFFAESVAAKLGEMGVLDKKSASQ